MQHRTLHILLLTLLTLSTTLTPITPTPHPNHPTQPTLPDYLTPLPTNYTPPACRFASPAHVPSPAHLQSNATLRSAFIRALLYWEGQFLWPAPCGVTCCAFESPGAGGAAAGYVGLHQPTMVTMDGHRLDVPSGLPLDGGAHMFTAASKESLHVALLALGLSSTAAAPLAGLLLSPGTGGERASVIAAALHQLAVKANSYDLFDCRFPGFGGFLPWVAIEEDGITPQPGWETTVPALDNGQLIWAVYGLLQVFDSDPQLNSTTHIPLNSTHCPSPPHAYLTAPNTTIATRYRHILSRWQANALSVFYDRQGRFRDVSNIRNVTERRITSSNYYTAPGCDDDCYLDDPYEGELFTVFCWLYANWTGWDDRQLLWQRKRAKLQLATLSVPGYGNITTQRGYWFSAHEQWKYLFLPYRDVAINDAVFVLGEKARLLWSHARKVPGLYASINGLAADNAAEMEYHSDCGVQQLAMVDVSTDFEITPYGTMNTMLLMHPVQHVTTHPQHSTPPEPPTTSSATNVLLNIATVRQEALAAIASTFTTTNTHANPAAADPPANSSVPNYVGLVWLAQSIAHPRGQTCFGVTEGVATNGTATSPLHTWDSSITTALAVLGGLVGLVRQRMQVDAGGSGGNAYDEFVGVVEAEWSRVFGGGRLEGWDVEWVLPSAVVPAVVDEWSSCTETSNVCVCEAGAGERAAAKEESGAVGGWKGNVHARKRGL